MSPVSDVWLNPIDFVLRGADSGIPTRKDQLDASDGMALQIADRSTVTTGSAHRTTVALSRKLYVVEP